MCISRAMSGNKLASSRTARRDDDVIKSRTASVPQLARVELASLAVSKALSTDGVIAAVEGPNGAWLTASDEETYPGVTAAALPDGTYEISLHLVAALSVPLPALAERIRSRVEAAAADAGLADVLGPINIAFEDVREAAV
jgi:hypothetical protein